MAALVFLLFVGFLLTVSAINIYGLVLCFKKKWYVGLAGLVFPMFALIVGLAKVVLKKDILK